MRAMSTRPQILRALRIPTLLGPEAPSQPQWTEILRAASVDPASPVSLRLGQGVHGNLVTLSETNAEWLIAFAETASLLGISILLWVTPGSELCAEDMAVLSGLGVVVGADIDTASVSAGTLLAVLVQEHERLRQILGYEPRCLRVNSVDRLILQEANRAGFSLLFRDGSGMNRGRDDVFSLRVSRTPQVESEWLFGRRRATLRILADAVAAKLDPKRFDL